jgi:hypothetical protein
MSIESLARETDMVEAAIARLHAEDPIPALLGRPQWARTYGRLNPGARCYATLVYERTGSEPVRVDLRERAEPGAHRLPGCLGWAQLIPCCADPALASLDQACRFYAVDKIVRYRPGKRCTLRGTADGAPAYVKVFADERGAEMAEEATVLHLAAVQGQLDFAVARCLGWNGGLRAIAHEALDGVSICDALLGHGGADLGRRIGRALATLPTVSLAPRSIYDAASQMERSSRYVRKMARAAPIAADAAAALLTALEAAHEAAPDTQLRPIHGAPHPQQWLEHAGRLALVDFDRLSLGPVEIDAATFLAELDFESGARDQVNQVAAAFLGAYAIGVGGCDERVLAIYRMHKHLAKAYKVALSLSAAREARAARILRNARAELAEAMQ